MLISLRTQQELHKAKAKDDQHKHGEAMLHINAAIVFAMQEMPSRVPSLRAAAERYRLQHFPRRGAWSLME